MSTTKSICHPPYSGCTVYALDRESIAAQLHCNHGGLIGVTGTKLV